MFPANPERDSASKCNILDGKPCNLIDSMELIHNDWNQIGKNSIVE